MLKLTLENFNMKQFLALVACGLLLFSFGCKKKVDMSSPKARYSYAIGSQIGRNIKSQSIDLDEAAFEQALNDQIEGKKLQMTETEMKAALQVMAKSRNQKMQKKAEENKKKGEAFLEANKKKPGVKTTASGLQYIVEKGGKGKKPKATDVVKVNYKGTLIDGKEFDSSYKRNKPAEFPVKAVIPGWTEALQLMKVGSKYKLFIPAKLAYGSRGNPSIPGNSVLIFEVELLDIVKK